MKIHINHSSRQGSALLAALLIALVVSITLASYLVLITNHSYSITRSKAWNDCIPVLEAGIEEAMTQIHFQGTSNLSANSWTLQGDGRYHKTRTLDTNGSYYEVSIQPVDPPIIYSTGYIRTPMTDTDYLSRSVRVTTQQLGTNWGGMWAKSTITLGGGVTFDSFNSSVAAYNPTNHGTNALAVSNTNIGGAIKVAGGGIIYGMVATGAGGTVTTTGGGTVGDLAYVLSGTLGVQTSHQINDVNYQFDDQLAPYVGGAIPVSGAGGDGTNYTYLVDGTGGTANYYMSGNVSLSGGQTMIFKGTVNLYVTGKFTMTGGSYAYLAPGAKVNIWVGDTFSVSGGGIYNGTGLSQNLSLYGLNSCKDVGYSGSSAFVGTVNAPYADWTLGGGAQVFGSITANSIKINSGGAVHYDETLGGKSPYTMLTWNEY